MSTVYGDIVSIPVTIKENDKDKQIQIYNPVKETPQFISLLEIIKKWIVEKFDIHDIIPFTTKIMAVVNQAVSESHCGHYKKKLVLSLLYCCVKGSDLALGDKHIAYSVISNVAPSAIDTIVSIAKGEINVKETLHYVEKTCFSMFDSKPKLCNVIYEHNNSIQSSSSVSQSNSAKV